MFRLSKKDDRIYRLIIHLSGEPDDPRNKYVITIHSKSYGDFFKLILKTPLNYFCNFIRCISDSLIFYILSFLILVYIIFSLTDFPEDGIENRLYNMAVILAAVFGIPLALWRSRTAHKQAKTAEKSLRQARYQTAVSMLDSKTVATRLGGIYALERLGNDHPKEYHIEIMKLISTFVRLSEHNADCVVNGDSTECLADVEAAVQAVGRRNGYQRKLEDRFPIEDSQGFKIDFSHTNLVGASLQGLNLTNVILSSADLRKAQLSDTHKKVAHWMGQI